MSLCKGKCGFAAAVICAVLTGTAWAVVVVQDATETLSGVDSAGSLSADNGGDATGKIYKDTNTGVLYELVSGIVINASGSNKKLSYPNQGVSITDPGSSQTFTASSDLEVIYPAQPGTGGFALAGRVAVFFPPTN